MVFNFNGNRPSSIIWDHDGQNRVVQILQFNGAVVWRRAGESFGFSEGFHPFNSRPFSIGSTVLGEK